MCTNNVLKDIYSRTIIIHQDSLARFFLERRDAEINNKENNKKCCEYRIKIFWNNIWEFIFTAHNWYYFNIAVAKELIYICPRASIDACIEGGQRFSKIKGICPYLFINKISQEHGPSSFMRIRRLVFLCGRELESSCRLGSSEEANHSFRCSSPVHYTNTCPEIQQCHLISHCWSEKKYGN